MTTALPGAGLRATNKATTAARIQDAALHLAERDGWAATTAEQIALKAGVSPRTFFRYSPAKIDAVASIADPIEARVSALLLPQGRARTLALVESAIRVALADSAAEAGETFARLRRVRLLLRRDAGLRDALLERDGRHVLDLVERWGTGHDDDALVIPIALVTLRVAIDDWAASVSADASEVIGAYDRRRAGVRGLLLQRTAGIAAGE